MRCATIGISIALAMATLAYANTFALAEAPQDRDDYSTEVEAEKRRVAELEGRQQEVVEEAKKLIGAQREQALSSSDPDLAEKAKALARLRAEIEKSVDEYMKRPRKKFVDTRAVEYALAPYLEAWTQKVGRISKLNYPEAARGKLYGSVVVYIELNAGDGSVHNVEVARSSGHKILDDAALSFIRKAAPYGPVPREAMGTAEILSFARALQFVRGDNESSHVASASSQPPSDKEAKPVNQLKLFYPPESVARGEEGEAIVKLSLFPDGTVESAELEKSTGYTRLDEAALLAAHQLKGRPNDATRNGKWIYLPVKFRLTDAQEGSNTKFNPSIK